MNKPIVVCLMGPTASGKSDLALGLASAHPFEIVSVDSAMVYRGMDIGTAKPSADVLSRHPHHLIDILDPSEPYSAADFRRDAAKLISDISARGRIPLLVGGTMLYFKALSQGLAALPSADPQVRARISALAAAEGWPAVHERLAQVDPDSARRIHPNDPQRLQRALEVYELSGRPMSDLHLDAPPLDCPWELVQIAVVPEDRKALHRRIEQRFLQMLDEGLVDEVRRLHARGDIRADMPSMKAVGYRQVWGYLEGEYDEKEMLNKGVAATRQLAKRQLTWLRSWPGLDVIPVGEPSAVLKILRSGSILS